MKKILFILATSLFAVACGTTPVKVQLLSGGEGLTSTWVVEATSEQTSISVQDDSMEIINPGGLTLWYDMPLEGEYEISYSVKFVMEGGESDRLSDLNCFWGAVDPESPDNIYERGEWRGGTFSRYNTMDLFYVGYGGNDNSSTRFRRYYGGDYYDTGDDEKIRPVIKEHRDAADLLKPNQWLNIVIRVKDGRTTYSMDGKSLFNHTLEVGQDRGYFGLRLLRNHTIIKSFSVKKLDTEFAEIDLPKEAPDYSNLSFSKRYYFNRAEWDLINKTIAKHISKRPAMAFVENNPDLPNILIIGTSISIGYTPFVREYLEGVANVYRIPSNSNSTAFSLEHIDFWLGDVAWDVIHVNWGLHDLKYVISDDHRDVPPADYQTNLRELFTRLSATGAQIVWANTSYYPDRCNPRRDVGDDVLYNNLADEVLKSFPGVVVDDQYTLTKNNPQNQLPNNVHFTDEGYRQQGKQASEVIRTVLDRN